MPIHSFRLTTLVCLAWLVPLSGNADPPSQLADCKQVTKGQLNQCKDGAAYTATRVDLLSPVRRKFDLAESQYAGLEKGDYKRILKIPSSGQASKLSLNSDDSVLNHWHLDPSDTSKNPTTLDQRDARSLATISTKKWQEPVVALSPDGKRVVLDRGNRGLALVEAGTGRELANIPGSGSSGFSPDSRWLAVTFRPGNFDEGFERIYSAETGVLQLEIPGAGRSAFSPSGTHAALAGWGYFTDSSEFRDGYPYIRVYEIATRRLIRDHNLRSNRILGLRFGPDERTVVATLSISEPNYSSGSVIWDWPTGQEALIDCIYPVVMTDGRLLSFKDNRIIVWDARTAVPMDAFEVGSVESMTSTAGNRIVVATRIVGTQVIEWQVWERARH